VVVVVAVPASWTSTAQQHYWFDDINAVVF
jgi:hypothetical protein